jgi:hypothetical protein
MQKQITIVKSLPATIMGVLKIVTTMPADAKKMSKNLNTIKAGKQTIISGSSVVRVPSAGLGIKGTEMQLKEVRRNDFDQEQLNGWLIIYNTISAVYVTDFFERSVLPFSKKLVSGFKAVEGFFPSLRGYSDVVDKSLEAFAKAVTDLKASSQENIRLQYAQLNKDTELMVEANDEDVDEDME